MTSTHPVPSGETAVTEVAEWTTKLVASVVPNLTAVAPVKPVTVMDTEVPPLGEQVARLMEETPNLPVADGGERSPLHQQCLFRSGAGDACGLCHAGHRRGRSPRMTRP